MRQSAKTAEGFLFLSVLLILAAPAAARAEADLILTNGKILVDRDTRHEWVAAISIRKGFVSALGPEKEVLKERSTGTRIINLHGRVVLPGFNDSYVHAVSGGIGLARISLNDVKSIEELKARLKEQLSQQGAKTGARTGQWVFGSGWEQQRLAEKRPPNRRDLDAVVADRPVLLWNADYQAVSLNSAALEELGIGPSTPNPSHGEIVRSESGVPEGVITGEAAMEVAVKVDHPSKDEVRDGFLRFQEEALRSGITSVQGGPIRGENEARALDELFRTGALKIRYNAWGDLEHPEEVLSWREKLKSLPEEWVRFGGVIGFVDGVLGTRTAALLEPYSDSKAERGEPRYTQDRLSELVLAANRFGVPVVLHAIGDRAVSFSITAILRAKRQLFNSRLRNRIEHLELVPPSSFAALADHQIVLGIQPSHMIYPSASQSYNESRLGASRAKYFFPLRSFVDARAKIAMGSEFPVMPLNPMLGIYAATQRQHLDGKSSPALSANQKLSVSDAIEAYTHGGAFATREEHVKGSLREGKFADLVVWSSDPFKARGKELLSIKAVMTIVGGKVVFDSEQPTISAGK